MAAEQSYVSGTNSLPPKLLWLARRLLLAPEAPLIALLTGLALLFDGAPLFGLLTVALTLAFFVRVAALYLARAALAAGRYVEVAALVQISHAVYPYSADALALRGGLALASGDAEAAVAALRRSIDLFPESAEAHATLSGALLALGRHAEARRAARRALELAPGSALAHLYLAEAEHGLGVAALEVEDILRAGLAVAVTPDDEAALRCALAGHLLAEQRVAEAALMLSNIEAIIPRCTEAGQARLRLRYGELLIAQGQVERAREYLQSVAVIERAAGSA